MHHILHVIVWIALLSGIAIATFALMRAVLG